MQRTTDANVKSAFSYFCLMAKEAGIAGTENWVFYGGNSSYGYFNVVRNGEGGTVREFGTTKREAWEGLHHMAEAWRLASK